MNFINVISTNIISFSVDMGNSNIFYRTCINANWPGMSYLDEEYLCSSVDSCGIVLLNEPSFV